MRCTQLIHDVIREIETQVEDLSNIYYKPFDKSSIATNASKEGIVGEKFSSSQSFEEDQSIAVSSVSVDKDPLAVKLSIDFLPRFNRDESSVENDSSTLHIKTEFRFPKNSGCGHKVHGMKPKLCRLKFSPILISKSVNVMATLLSKECKLKKRTLMICSTLDIAVFARVVCEALDLSVIEYLHGLKFETPDSDFKEQTYSNWLRQKGCVLLTDNRGYRGLQHEQVLTL